MLYDILFTITGAAKEILKSSDMITALQPLTTHENQQLSQLAQQMLSKIKDD